MIREVKAATLESGMRVAAIAVPAYGSIPENTPSRHGAHYVGYSTDTRQRGRIEFGGFSAFLP
jgi:hypothetical protein